MLSFFFGSRGLRPDLLSPFGRKFQFCLLICLSVQVIHLSMISYTGRLCLKIVFPHFLQWSQSLPVVPSSGTRSEMKTHAHDMNLPLQSDARWKNWYGVSHWVSNSIHMTRTQQSDWKLGSWIINEFEKQPYQFGDKRENVIHKFITINGYSLVSPLFYFFIHFCTLVIVLIVEL